jgi:hypothetical protein
MCAGAHCPELQALEGALAEADPLLAVEHTAGRAESDQCRYDEEQRREQEHESGGQDPVHHRLQESSPTAEHRCLHLQQWEPGQRAYRDPRRGHVAQRRGDEQPCPAGLQLPGQPAQRVPAQHALSGDHDGVGLTGLDGSEHLVRSPQHGHADAEQVGDVPSAVGVCPAVSRGLAVRRERAGEPAVVCPTALGSFMDRYTGCDNLEAGAWAAARLLDEVQDVQHRAHPPERGHRRGRLGAPPRELRAQRLGRAAAAGFRVAT